MTSRAWVPIDPVDPRTTTPRVTGPAYGPILRAGRQPASPDLQVNGEVVGDREAEQQRVEAVEDAAVARKEGPEVLEAEIPLEHRLAEVAEEGTAGDEDPEHETLVPVPGA